MGELPSTAQEEYVMGKRSRRKGHSWEREVAHRLSKRLDTEVVRNLGEVRGDDLGKDLVGCEPLVVQCKCGVRPNLKGAWLEARDYSQAQDYPDEHIPIAIANIEKADPDDKRRSLELVVMSFDDFLEFVKPWMEDVL